MTTEQTLKEYEELLVKRDQYYKEAASYQTVYISEFGELIDANFELKVACIKEKKTISYCRRRMNRGLAVDVARMQSEIEQEMTLYYAQLSEMKRETAAAKEAKTVSEYQYSRSKKIYRRLAKKLHPDINAKTATTETLKDLWNRIVIAYHKSDPEALAELEVLARAELEKLGDDGWEIAFDDIEERIERAEREINEILTTEPYTYRALLEDEEKKKAHRAELEEEHEDLTRYLDDLRQTLEATLAEGGAKLVMSV